MERFRGITIILLLTVGAFAGAAAGKSTSTLLQEGLYAEEVDGDLDAAIKIYQQVIAKGAAQRSHVAQAMYRQGMCYLKKQDETRAKEVFAKLVSDYSDQTRVVEKVMPMLEELSNGDPAALMPPETVIYLEGGSPGRQFEKILKMLEGTPFENPLAAIGAGSGPGGDPGNERGTGYSKAGPENILAGLLNPSMMAEFKKIRGIGVGVTGVTNNDPPVIVVLYPGKSDALRGMLLMVLTAFGKPGEVIDGMQTVVLNDGGGAAYDDSTIIVASPKAYAAGQLAWCVKQHKGLIDEPTLASSNRSFAKVSKKDRQEHALTIWANVDEVFAGLKKLFPDGNPPIQIRMADGFVDVGNIDDLIAFLSIEEDRIAVETNIGFKDGHQSTAYNLIRTPKLNKAALSAVPSEAIALMSSASPGPQSAQAQFVSGKIKEKMGLEIGGDFFTNVKQITLFALPPAGEAVPGIPPIVMSLGVVMSSDDPQQTKQILTGLLTAANLLASQSANEGTGERYQFDLVNQLRIHCYADRANKATVMSLNPAVIDAAVSAAGNRKSVTAAGPLKEAVNAVSPATSKVALINVGGMLGFVEAGSEADGLLAELAKDLDKTTFRFRTQEEQNNLNARAEISGLPPVGQVIGPAMQLAKIASKLKAKAREQARMAGVPGVFQHTDQAPEIDGRADDLWSEVRRHRIRNTSYAPASDRSDLTAFYRAMWDKDNLYVLVNVMDEALKNDSDEFYFDDCVEVFIDADNSKSAGYGDNDYQYFFEWAEADPQMGESQHGRTDGVQFAVGRADVGYRVEIKFPWSTLGTDPAVGRKIGIDVHVNDDDDGGERDTKVMWRSVEDNTWQNPRAMGIAELGGMVAWWKLDESEGRAADSSGNGNDGRFVGAPKRLSSGGKISGALEFDGVDDCVDCGNNAVLDITSEITIAAWVKTNDSGNSQFNPYVTKGDAAYGLKHHETNNLEFVINDGSWHVAHHPVDSSFNGAWHHLVGTYDGEALKLYVDGELKTTTPCVGCRIAVNDFNLNIARNSELPERLYNGATDEVRIYSYALSQGQVARLHSEGK